MAVVPRLTGIPPRCREDAVSRILCVHGIAQQFRGPQVLASAWVPALRDGVRLAGLTVPDPDEIQVAFFGDRFRPGAKSVDVPPYTAVDVTDDESALIEQWWSAAAAIDPRVPRPDAETKVRTPRGAQRALNALSRSRFFAGLGERALIWSAKQVRMYFSDPTVRDGVRAAVAELLTDDTRVVVGHSLGSVVAYEVLAARRGHRVRSFVTLGSPLGIRNIVFDRLEPAPTDAVGAWPGVDAWTNIADDGDVVALVKQLAPAFGPDVVDHRVHNGAQAHEVTRYLTAIQVGRAIAAGLDG
jgi:hypothetical protein